MPKAGDAYQDAVAEVARQLDPNARIVVGEWIEGPDGERDCDVGVYPASVSPRFVYIECKDWKRPVGIEVVDALESKRKDVNADIAILCSNSGFSADALRKAARVGIPALSALIERDSRIRVQVQEEIYTRKIRLAPQNITYHWKADADTVATICKETTARDVIHDNRPLLAWVRDKCIFLAAMTARSCTVVANYKFWRPLQFHLKDGILPATGITLTIPCEVQWCSQVIRLSASSGMYDYLRHRVILGGGTQQYHMHNVDYNKWNPIDFVPEHLDKLLREMKPGRNEAIFDLSLLSGVDTVDDLPAPNIDPYVETAEITRTDSAGESRETEHSDPAAQEKANNVTLHRPVRKLEAGPWPKASKILRKT